MDYSKVIYNIVGAAYNVHNELGWGIAEAVYEEALCLELNLLGLIAIEQQELPVYYRDVLLKKRYRMDVVVENKVIVELKAVECIQPEYRAQLFNYLRLTKMPVGVLINFGKSVEVERYWYDALTNEITFYTNKCNS